MDLKEEEREEEAVNSDLSKEEIEEASKETDLSDQTEDFKGVAKIIESEERIQRDHVRSSVNQTENLLIRKNKKRDLMLS